MINVAILTGGPSAEREISENSAHLVAKYLPQDKYTSRLIFVELDGWFDHSSGVKVDRNDFTLTIDNVRHRFDFVFLMIHGTPAEDGKIQGYFEMLGIPHSTCDTLTSALAFNKQMCKDYLRRFDIPMADSVILRKGENIASESALKLPVFVKPNNNGSSYGVSKVSDSGQWLEAVENAFQYDDEIMVESFIKGREFGCGVIRQNQELHALPPTEIIPAQGKEFFDYEAKYLGASQEITPADLSSEKTMEMQTLSKKVYRALNCRGIVRFDYILQDDTFYLLEANTIPGMSEASIVPQQALAAGWSIPHLLDVVIQDCMQS